MPAKKPLALPLAPEKERLAPELEPVIEVLYDVPETVVKMLSARELDPPKVPVNVAVGFDPVKPVLVVGVVKPANV